MFDDGHITFRAQASPLYIFGFSSEAVRAIVLAALTILISYQATAALIDICFGRKPYGFAKARDIELMLLSRRSSVVPVYRALFKSPDDDDGRENKIRFTVCAKLVILILLAPAVNVAAIFLTLEYDTNLTFKNSDFGGVALGIDMNASDSFLNSPADCIRAPVRLQRFEFSLSDFFICFTNDIRQRLPTSGNATVKLDVRNQRHVIIQVYTPAGSHFVVTSAAIVGNNQTEQGASSYFFHVPSVISEDDLHSLAQYTMTQIKQWCRTKKDAVETNTISNTRSVDVSVEYSIACDRDSRDSEWFSNLFDNVKARVSFVSRDELLVWRDGYEPHSNTNITDFQNADNELFVRRRNIYADVVVLSLIALGTVIFRLAVKSFTRNDLPRGIGVLVRDAIGVPCLDSMLQRRENIEWPTN